MALNQSDIPTSYSARWIDDLDGRTAFAKDLRNREAGIVADLGGQGAVSYLQRSLVRRGLFLEVLVRRTEARLAAGETLKDDELGRFTQSVNALLGVWKALGLQRRARDVPDLKTYLRQRQNGEATA